MAEEPNGVEHEPTPAELEREIDAIRKELDGVVAELDRRRHELTDWRLQLRRHRGKVLLIAGGLLAVVAGGIVLAVRRHREREQPLSKLRRFRQAVARMIDDPDSVARSSPSPRDKALAAGTDVAAAAGKSLLPRLVQRLGWHGRRNGRVAG